MDLKYYNSKIETIAQVSWRYLGDNEEIIGEYLDQDCFSKITYWAIPPEVKKIVVFHYLDLVPYGEEIIHKWIKEINAFGFPVFAKVVGDFAEFTISLDDYKHKIHLCCTLQLIRCLFERGIAYIPEIYFNFINAENAQTLEEKFAQLQHAHVSACNYVPENGCYNKANNNHMVTCNGNFNEPISIKTLFERVVASHNGVYSNNRNYLHGLWKNIVEKEI